MSGGFKLRIPVGKAEHSSNETNDQLNLNEDKVKECNVLLEEMKISVSKTEHKSSGLTPRRGNRDRHKPKKYGDFLELSPTKSKQEEKKEENISDDSDDNEEFDQKHCPQKPTALFSDDDVGGQDIYQFTSRHSKQNLQNKVNSAISSSRRSMDLPIQKNKTQLYSIDSRSSTTNGATPKRVKDMIKKRIIREVESNSDEGDFSGSSSDYVPDESNSEIESSSSSSSSPSNSASEEDERKTNKLQISKTRHMNMMSKDSEYVVTPDNYFIMNSSNKIATSDHTLARLKNLNFIENLKAEDAEISNEHRDKIIGLNQSYKHLFNRWLYVLSENFNIILFGIGSKRSILHQFQMEKLQDFPCIVVNGFFPGITMKSILETIVIDLLDNDSVPSNIGDIVNLIDTELTENNTELFLIIHNIDGTMFRNAKAQAMLANISQIKNVHTIATIDHINAPLLWDHSKLSKFNFTWWDVTTFLPYTEETSFENSLMTQRNGELQLSSLKSVYQSLTTNAKAIFNIIIEYQLENNKQTHYRGIPFKELYSKSREQFLVSSDIALRAQLTEFLDHKLAKMKRAYDGSENIVIPIESSLLVQFLDQQNS